MAGTPIVNVPLLAYFYDQSLANNQVVLLLKCP
jgi:hypothetical protein